MIPKTIHYCWFGDKEIPESGLKCIESWKRFCPGFELKKWAETNIDIASCPYVKEAYEAKKWAFVSDYARFWILYNYGGVYFDTDVELIAGIDDIMDNDCFMAIEQPIKDDGKFMIASGLGLGSTKGFPIIKEILDSYATDRFVGESGVMQSYTVVHRVTDIMEKHGYRHMNTVQDVDGAVVYPWQYFCPMNYNNGKVTVSSETRSIHHYDMTWKTQEEIDLKNMERSFRVKCGDRLGFLLFRCYRFIKKHIS